MLWFGKMFYDKYGVEIVLSYDVSQEAKALSVWLNGRRFLYADWGHKSQASVSMSKSLMTISRELIAFN